MKLKIFLLISVFLLVFAACAPAGSKENGGHEQVTINLPEDDSVNGYRLPEEESTATDVPSQSISQQPSSSSSADNGKTQSPTSSDENKTEIYIGNKNSRVLHRAGCGSVKTMKEENKAEFSDKEAPLAEGYTPCKRCKP